MIGLQFQSVLNDQVHLVESGIPALQRALYAPAKKALLVQRYIQASPTAHIQNPAPRCQYTKQGNKP